MRCERCGAETASSLCPKCSAELSDFPIPASFFSPEESAPRHTFTLSDDAHGQGGFTITTNSLQIEAVSPTAPPEASSAPEPEQVTARPAQQPESVSRRSAASAAPPVRPSQPPQRRPEPAVQRTTSSEPVPNAEGFYMVPYDESLWATLSRIRHRWLLPVLVGAIFVTGMTTGIVMARSAANSKNQPAESAEETAPAETSASADVDDLLTAEMELVYYFRTELLPEYGYIPVDTEITAEQADGIWGVYALGARMTVLRLSEGALRVESYVNENGAIRLENEAVQKNLLQALPENENAVIVGDAGGIYLGSTRIFDAGVGTAESAAPVALCAGRSTGEAAYLFSDYTDIRESVPEQANGWQSLYRTLLTETLRSLAPEDTAYFRLLDVDADDIPELELHQEDAEGGTTEAALYTVADGALRLLTTEDAAVEYACVAGENCFRESVEAADGTYFYWYHIENGAAVRDHTEWFGLMQDEWVYMIDGETYTTEEYAAQRLPAAEQLETEIRYTALTQDAIDSIA